MAPEQARDTRQASAASDVFSLGATLLYAATGHAPYQGETVMDVLVRLVTEPPDMAGLPGELTGLVTACLERSPRQRPTSATLLSQLGPYVEGGAAHNGRHAYLTDPAMALIGDYQHGPQLAAQAPAGDGAGDEATFGSHTALSAPHAPATRRWLARRPAVLPGRPAPALRPVRRRSAWLSVAGLAGAAVALIAAGAVTALALDGGSSGPSPASSPNQAALGFPPPTGPPPSSFAPLSGSRPGIEMLQPVGDGNTGFVVHGAGWPPYRTVTLALAGRANVVVRLAADGAGSFNYTIDQGHMFYPGPIPAGRHEVVVIGDGRTLSTVFQVLAPPAPVPSPTP
jgi:hypothetical protein